MSDLWIQDWAQIRCPHCRKLNWICYGDPNDDTVPNKCADALKCFDCSRTFWLNEEWKYSYDCQIEDGMTEQEILDEYAFTVDGKERP